MHAARPCFQRILKAIVLVASLGWLAGAHAQAPADPLPSWNDGAVKKSITDFIPRVTTAGSADFVPLDQRIATFDNDGTLWAEQPMYFQIIFAIDRVKALAAKNPEWKKKQPFKAALEDDRKALAALGEPGFLQILAATHTGVTTEEFAKIVADWLATARHPRFDRPFTDLVYQPMLEMLAYMRANGFKTFIVSGGGIEFMRPWTEKTYGIPPEQVVGSSAVTKYQMRTNDIPVLLRERKVEFVDDKAGKPEGINRFIGRRPVFAFGNSDGDKEMLEWTAAGSGARFMGRNSPVGRLDKAWDEAVRRGWTVVDMKRDWKKVFPFDP